MSFGDWILAGAAIAIGFYMLPFIFGLIVLAIAGIVGVVDGRGRPHD